VARRRRRKRKNRNLHRFGQIRNLVSDLTHECKTTTGKSPSYPRDQVLGTPYLLSVKKDRLNATQVLRAILTRALHLRYLRSVGWRTSLPFVPTIVQSGNLTALRYVYRRLFRQHPLPANPIRVRAAHPGESLWVCVEAQLTEPYLKRTSSLFAGMRRYLRIPLGAPKGGHTI